MVTFCEDVIKAGRSGHAFCTALYYAVRYKQYILESEEVRYDNGLAPKKRLVLLDAMVTLIHTKSCDD